HLAYLVLESRLWLPDRGALRLRVTVNAADENGRRACAVHARPDGDDEAPWTRHGTGVLAPGRPYEPVSLAQWPPPGAAPIDVTDLYARLEDAGLHYADPFRGLRA